MLKWSTERRQFVAEKLGDAANILFGGLVVGEFIGASSFSALPAAAGIVLWLLIVGAAVRLIE